MEIADYGWDSVCIGANFDGHFRGKHEHCVGEGYVHTQSSDFRKGVDSEGDPEIN